MEWISLSMLNGASKTPFNSISEANNWRYAIQKEINGMKEEVYYYSRHTQQPWEITVVAGCVWNCDRVRNYEGRDSVSGSERRDQQLERWLRGSENWELVCFRQ